MNSGEYVIADSDRVTLVIHAVHLCIVILQRRLDLSISHNCKNMFQTIYLAKHDKDYYCDILKLKSSTKEQLRKKSSRKQHSISPRHHGRSLGDMLYILFYF